MRSFFLSSGRYAGNQWLLRGGRLTVSVRLFCFSILVPFPICTMPIYDALVATCCLGRYFLFFLVTKRWDEETKRLVRKTDEFKTCPM